MLRGYIRPEPRFSAAKQRPSLESAKASPIYQEAERRRGDAFPARDGLINSLRKSAKDMVGVSDFHRLAINPEDLKETLKRIREKGATVLETRTGRRADDAGELAEMILEAVLFYRGKGLTHIEAVKLGRKGAANSPATKPKPGRMPVLMAQAIWRDEALDKDQALDKINADPAYPTKYSQNTAYRRLGSRNVRPGRKPKGHAKAVAVKRKKAKLQEGAIYFLRANGRGPVKIGFTTDLDGRVSTLSISHHHKLMLVGVIEGTYADEQALHKRFKAYHVKGEWFKVEGALKKYMATLPKLEDV